MELITIGKPYLFQEYITLYEENYSRYDYSMNNYGGSGLTRFQKVRLNIQVSKLHLGGITQKGP